MCHSAKILAEVDEQTQIHYTRSKRMYTFSGRDLVNVFYKKDLGDGRFVVLARSIETDEVAPVSGVVRAHCHLIGSLFG